MTSIRRFPYHDATKAVALSRVRVALLMRPGSGQPNGLKATLLDPTSGSHAADGGSGVAAAPNTTLAGLPALSFSLASGAAGLWSLQVAEGDIPMTIASSASGHARIDPGAIVDVCILCEYVLQ